MASPETQAQWGLLFSCCGQSCGVNPVRDEASSGLNSESSSLPPAEHNLSISAISRLCECMPPPGCNSWGVGSGTKGPIGEIFDVER
jgi:hypothetical protein